MVVEGAEYNWVCPRSNRNVHIIKTNVQCRVRGSGGHLGDEDELGDVKADWQCQNAHIQVRYDGKECRMDGAMSGTRCNLKRVKTKTLDEDDAGQRQRYKHTMVNIPRPSTTPTHDQRPPTNHPNPSCCQGWLKPWSRQVSQIRARKTAHQVIRVYWGHIGQIRHTIHVLNSKYSVVGKPAMYLPIE